jgi:Cu(I)/Ag(I) efflux system membrane fusion protein
MKRNYIFSTFLILLFFVACKDKKTQEVTTQQHEHSAAEKYTCPMHPQIIRSQKGQCPICGMDLVPMSSMSAQPGIDSSLASIIKPVDQQVIANISTIIPESGMRIFSEEVQGTITYDTRNQTSIASRVSGRIERLMIKYNYQPVKAGQLIMEIYSPDLVAAQRELLFIYHNDKNDPMLQKAKQRLSLLGMTEGQIQQIIRSDKPSYRVGVFSNASGYILEKSAATIQRQPIRSVQPGGSGMDEIGLGNPTSGMSSPASPTAVANAPVLIREGQYVNAGESLFTIYKENSLVAEFAFPPELASEVKPGVKLVYRLSSDPENIFTGTIGLIQPTISSGQNFTLARVYIPNRSNFSFGSLLTANIPIVKKNGWWIPQQAVLRLGNRSVIFKKTMNGFTPEEIKTGFSTKGTVQVLTDISDWEIASNASYLVDSESFIKTGTGGEKK